MTRRPPRLPHRLEASAGRPWKRKKLEKRRQTWLLLLWGSADLCDLRPGFQPHPRQVIPAPLMPTLMKTANRSAVRCQQLARACQQQVSQPSRAGQALCALGTRQLEARCACKMKPKELSTTGRPQLARVLGMRHARCPASCRQLHLLGDTYMPFLHNCCWQCGTCRKQAREGIGSHSSGGGDGGSGGRRVAGGGCGRVSAGSRQAQSQSLPVAICLLPGFLLGCWQILSCFTTVEPTGCIESCYRFLAPMLAPPLSCTPHSLLPQVLLLPIRGRALWPSRIDAARSMTPSITSVG